MGGTSSLLYGISDKCNTNLKPPLQIVDQLTPACQEQKKSDLTKVWFTISFKMAKAVSRKVWTS